MKDSSMTNQGINFSTEKQATALPKTISTASLESAKSPIRQFDSDLTCKIPKKTNPIAEPAKNPVQKQPIEILSALHRCQ